MVNVEDGPYHITKWEKHQSVEQMGKIKSKNAIKQAAYRQRQKEKRLLLSDGSENTIKEVTRYVTCDVTNGYSNQTEVEVELDNTTTLLEREFEKVKSAYEILHGELMPYKDSIILSGLLENGVGPELIITVMKNRYKKSVRTFGYYEGAIRDVVNSNRSSNGSSTIGREGKAAKWTGYRNSFLGVEADE
jgi:hypothetical protein